MIPKNVDRARTLGRVTLWGSLAFNVGVLILDLLTGCYRCAAWMSIVIAAIAWWLRLAPIVDAWLDAKRNAAVVQLRMTEQAHEEIVKHVREGRAQFSVTGVRLN